MITRTYDAAAVTAVANHPDVRPWLGGGVAPWDAAVLVDVPQNITLWGPGGGFLCVQSAPGIFEIHSLFLPEARGAATMTAHTEAARQLFDTYDARELRTAVPANNRAALGLARAAHFVRVGTLPASFVTPDGTLVDTHYFLLTRARWESYTSPVKELTSCPL